MTITTIVFIRLPANSGNALDPPDRDLPPDDPLLLKEEEKPAPD